MVRCPTSVWEVTLGPFKPDIYEYYFSVDGLRTIDTGAAISKPPRQINTSLILIPGSIVDDARVAVRREIADNLLAAGKILPMIIVVPDTETDEPVAERFGGKDLIDNFSGRTKADEELNRNIGC